MPKRKSKKKSPAKKVNQEKTIEADVEIVQEGLENSKNPINTEKSSELIAEVENINEIDIKSKFLSLENENAELKATIEKARKKLRILVKKLDLTEEREDQWRIACHNIASMFAEKSQISLDDVLKKFEAPIEDGLAI